MRAATLLGLGEVGRVVAEDLDLELIRAWDTAFGDPASRASRNAVELRLAPAPDAASSTADADVIFSAVTAANALIAARSVAGHMPRSCWYVDLNSASPGQKVAAADVIERAGGRYVEAAVMSPIHPLRLAGPILLGGRHAAEFSAVGEGLGWTGFEVFSDRVGPAAATKLCRSVVVKGLEALVTESLLTARHWGVEESVLGSLSNVIPVDDWDALAAYLVSRSVTHGARRGEEMREAVETVMGAGVAPLMSVATAERQEWAGQFGGGEASQDLWVLLDRMRSDA
jgi:3-hydroxyisobutyrate dehydrogenase-like beta-hydroxyacid dehydrogenase